MAYTPLLNLTTISLASVTTSTWTTLATGVPSSATGVKLLWVAPSSALGSFTHGVRMGPAGGASTDTTATGIAIGGGPGSPPLSEEWDIGIDSSQQIQYFTSDTTPTHGTLYVLGYYGAESVFFKNAILISALTTSFATYSCSAAIPAGGVAGFFIITGGDYDSYIRQPGSADNFSNGSDANTIRNWTVGVDGSQNVVAKSFHSGTLYCKGYMTSGIVWHNSAVAVTSSLTAGSFSNIAQAGGDTAVLANLYYMNATGASPTIQIAGQGASTIPVGCAINGVSSGPLSAYAPSQANFSTITAVSLYELGYFTSGGGASGQYGMLMGVGQ